MLLSPEIMDPQYITYGGYQTENEASAYFPQLNTINAHRIVGSFHWEIALNQIQIGTKSYKPGSNRAFLDTGTNSIIVPQDDYRIFVETLCAVLKSTENKCQDYEGSGIMMIENCKENYEE